MISKKSPMSRKTSKTRERIVCWKDGTTTKPAKVSVTPEEVRQAFAMPAPQTEMGRLIMQTITKALR